MTYENLTPREIEVIELLCKGYDDEQIMDTLCVTSATVHAHLIHLYQKSHISDGKHKGQSTKRLRLALWYLKEHRELLDKFGF